MPSVDDRQTRPCRQVWCLSVLAATVSGMTTTGLEVRLHQGRERAEVTQFTKTVDEVIRTLREIDRTYVAGANRAIWVIADLAHDHDDMIIRVEPRLRLKTTRDAADFLVPVDAFVNGAAELRENADVPPLFVDSTVNRLVEIAKPNGGVQSVSIARYNGKAGPDVPLSEVVVAHALEAVRPQETSMGSLTGILTSLGDRRGKKIGLSIVDSVTKRAVSGTATEDMADVVRDLWRHRVLVGGELTRNGRGQVIKIHVDRVEALPDPGSAHPKLSHLLGAAPDWLGGRSVDDYLSEVRGA